MTRPRLDILKEMLEKEPKDSFLNYALALEHIQINEIPKAISIIEVVLQKDENYLGAYYQLGKLYEQTQQKELAINIYKKGIVIAMKQNNSKTMRELKEALMNYE